MSILVNWNDVVNDWTQRMRIVQTLIDWLTTYTANIPSLQQYLLVLFKGNPVRSIPVWSVFCHRSYSPLYLCLEFNISYILLVSINLTQCLLPHGLSHVYLKLNLLFLIMLNRGVLITESEHSFVQLILTKSDIPKSNVG